MKNHRLRPALALLLVLLLLASLVACGTSYDQDTYNKIKMDMSLKEVIAILGEPTTSKGINMGGLSGTSATWKDKHGTITLQLINGKVKMKSFTKPE